MIRNPSPSAACGGGHAAAIVGGDLQYGLPLLVGQFDVDVLWLRMAGRALATASWAMR